MSMQKLQVEERSGPTAYVQACELIKSGRHAQAIPLLMSGLEVSPEDVDTHIRLLECYISTWQVSQAADQYQQLVGYLTDQQKEQLDIKRLHMFVLYLQHRYKEAYRVSLSLPDSVRFHPQNRLAVFNCLRFLCFTEYDERYESDVLYVFKQPEVDKRGIQKRAIELLMLKYNLMESALDTDINLLANSELFLAYLELDYSVSPPMESLIIKFRKTLLTQALSTMDLSDAYTPLVTSLGWQGWHNEYIHAVDRDEASLIKSLDELLAQQIATPGFTLAQVEGLLLLIGMYMPFAKLSCANQLLRYSLNQWPISLAALARQTLYGCTEELKFAAKVPSIGSIDNEVSQKVREQYEENPYPRWKKCVKLDQKTDYYIAMKQVWLEKDDPLKPSESNCVDVLVAGCGTGQHPLQVALNHRANVTAIDITRRSLGYGAMKAEAYKADNLKFIHMDLLDVSELGRKFDAVESSGVLHHMEDPELGLQALIEVTKPGGFIFLGLYSELARKAVVLVRKAFLQSTMEPTLENMRAIRAAILSPQAGAEYREVARFGDFYASSPCRDLLFHAQEHRYTIPLIRDLLNRNSLQFLGFRMDNQPTMDRFIDQYGHGELRNLDAWHEFEQANPRTFVNMYQFYVKTPDQETVH